MYIPIDVGIWSNKKFKALPNSDCRVIYMYLLTNPAITLTGIYNLDMDDCKLKTRIRNGVFEAGFNEVINGKYNIEYDGNAELIWVRTRFERIKGKSAKVVIGAIEELNQINHPFRDKFIEKYKDELEPFSYRIKGHKLEKEEILTEEFLVNASRIYNSRKSLRGFMERRGISAEKIDAILPRALPNLKEE